MSIKVAVAGKEYQLDESTKNIMELFNEADALDQINANEPVIFILFSTLSPPSMKTPGPKFLIFVKSSTTTFPKSPKSKLAT